MQEREGRGRAPPYVGMGPQMVNQALEGASAPLPMPAVTHASNY